MVPAGDLEGCTKNLCAHELGHGGNVCVSLEKEKSLLLSAEWVRRRWTDGGTDGCVDGGVEGWTSGWMKDGVTMRRRGTKSQRFPRLAEVGKAMQGRSGSVARHGRRDDGR